MSCCIASVSRGGEDLVLPVVECLLYEKIMTLRKAMDLRGVRYDVSLLYRIVILSKHTSA